MSAKVAAGIRKREEARKPKPAKVQKPKWGAGTWTAEKVAPVIVLPESPEPEPET